MTINLNEEINQFRNKIEKLTAGNTKFYFCPGNYEALPPEERKKKLEERDRNYKKYLEECKKIKAD